MSTKKTKATGKKTASPTRSLAYWQNRFPAPPPPRPPDPIPVGGGSIEAYLKSASPREAGQYLLHLRAQDFRSKIPEPSAKRRKNPALTGDELILFENAVASFRMKEMERHSYTEIMVQDAFRRSDKRTFEIIAMALDYAPTFYQTKFGRIVLEAMQVAANIMQTENRFPTKTEVKLGVKLAIGINCYPIEPDAAAEWTPVWRNARLKFLESGKAQRTKTKHGDKYTAPKRVLK